MGRSGKTTENAGTLSRKHLPPRTPEGKPQAQERGVCVSRGGPPEAKTGQQGGVGGLQGHRETLRQAEWRRSETAGNAGSLPTRPFPFQKHPGVSWVGYKVPGFEAGSVCLLQKATSGRNRVAKWCKRVAGTQGGKLKHKKGRRGKRAENAGSLPKRPLPP